MSITRDILEALNDSYPTRGNFQSEEIEDEEENEDGEMVTVTKDVLSPVQMVRFKDDNGNAFVWYARQDRFGGGHWEIAFGLDKGTDERGSTRLDIELTGHGAPFRILATVVEIINRFVEFDENAEVRSMWFSSDGDKRTRVYMKHIVPRIEKFKVSGTRKCGNETTVTLERVEW